MVKALNVAEKPSVAKELAAILSKGSSRKRNGHSQYNHIFEFQCAVMGQQNVQMAVTSVLGHLMEIEFVPPYSRNWSSCQPVALFHIPVQKLVREDAKPLERTLQQEARSSQWLILWLDCDREGENIAFEVSTVCKQVNPRLRIFRAKFSALIPREIWRAVETLVEPDACASEAVDARQEIDLRLGAAFTRFQTQRLQQRFEQLSDGVISYGPCQFPTLGFVVDRFKKIEAFVSEPFWNIGVEYEAEDSSAEGGIARASFNWTRERLYDQLACLIIYEMCLEEPCVARVISVDSRDTSKWRPVPLATVELQKRASRHLHMGAEHTMKVAEDLYQKGFISYPRTETEKFSKNFDIQTVLQDHLNHPQWGGYVDKLINQGGFQWPREGKNDDQAHPPIHPTKSVGPDSLGTEDEKKLYAFVCKHFLACCSKDAKGHTTTVTIELGAECFKANGLMVFEKNWLDIYHPWEKWNAKNIPIFQVGQTFTPSAVQMQNGRTEPPSLLSESDLISEMDKKGIGTDATIAQHIKTIQERKYAEKDGQARFSPTILGLALYDGYNEIGYALTKPNLRAQMEKDCMDIARGLKTAEEVKQSCLQHMKTVFEGCLLNAKKLDEAVAQHFDALGTGNNSRVKQRRFSKCGVCQGMMDLKETTGEKKRPLVYCNNCTHGFQLPWNGIPAAHDHICPLCNFQVISISTGNSYNGKGYTVCPHCFSNPPESVADPNGFRCFQCSATCPLAGKVSGQDVKIMDCRKCGADMTLGKLEKNNQVKFRIGCKGYPACKCTIWLPDAVNSVEPSDETCAVCSRGQSLVFKLKFKFARSKIPPEIRPELTDCPLCSRSLKDIGVQYSGFSATDQLSLSGSRSQSTTRTGPASLQYSAASRSQNNPRQAGNSSQFSTASRIQSSFRQTENPSQFSAGSSNTSECYKCRKVGHFASSCPGTQDSSFGRTGSTNTSECYKCHKVGHFASSCPGAQDSSSERSGPVFRRASMFNDTPQPKNNFQHSSSQLNSFDEDVPSCPGHDLPCVKRTTNKPGANNGRKFYVCSQAEQCKFFKWEDETASGDRSFQKSFSAPKTQPKNAFQQTPFSKDKALTCGFCQEIGHGSRHCPLKR